MGFIRPATPGFIVTVVATGLLAVVSFCVPWIRSVFFLKASLSFNNESGNITFGTLGYCLELANGTICSKPSIGYELDINGLVGNGLPVKIPQVVVKWLTYCLFLHVVALILAAGSAVFGLLAHVREMAMTCFSTCISGFAAVVALLAFIFDLAFFFLARTRINAVPGGSATIGSAIWLTLAAWVLLFFSGCFYTLGRCCVSNRTPRNNWGGKNEGPTPGIGPSNGYAEQMRLDAVKAEADRKARQHQPEVGLPAFSESQPLRARIEGDEVFLDDEEHQAPYRDHHNLGASAATGYGRRLSQNQGQGGGYTAGYVQAPPGGRAIDEYYSPSGGSTYPPRQPSTASSLSNYPASYAPSNYAYNPATTPPLPAVNNQYLSPGQQQYGQPRYANSPPLDYGHTASGTSYHSAVSHQQYPSNYSQYDAYDATPPTHAPATFNPETYNNTALLTQPYQSSYTTPQPQPDRSYTLGGDGYGADNSNPNSFFMYPGDTHPTTTSPAPLNPDVSAPQPSNTSPVKGPRAPRSPTYDDNPPGYDFVQQPGPRGEKR